MSIINNFLKKIFSPLPSISTSELEILLKKDKNIEILDVRTEMEYKNGHIINANNTPLDKIDYFRGNKDKEIYVICQTGIRSKRATLLLHRKGYKVKNVRGGMRTWNGPKI